MPERGSEEGGEPHCDGRGIEPGQAKLIDDEY